MIRVREKWLGTALALTIIFVADVATAQAPAELPCEPCIKARWALLQADFLALGDRRAAAGFLALKWLVETGSGNRQIADLERVLELATEADDPFAAGVVNLILGLDRAAQGDTATTESHLRRAIEHFGAIHEPLLVDTDGPGRIFLALLDLPGRVSGLASLPSERPESAARAGEALAHSFLAEILAGQGRLGAAEVEYLRALASSPLDHLARSGLGKVFQAQGRSADARQASADALEALDTGQAYESTSGRAAEARLRLLVQLVAADLSDEAQAAAHLAEVEALLPLVENAELKVAALSLIASRAFAAGQFEETIRQSSRALDLLYESGGPSEFEGPLRGLRGTSYSSLFANDRAIAELDRADALLQSEQFRDAVQVLKDIQWLEALRGEGSYEGADASIQDDRLRDLARALQAIHRAKDQGEEAFPEVIETQKNVVLSMKEPGWEEMVRNFESMSSHLGELIADANRKPPAEAERAEGPADSARFVDREALYGLLFEDLRQVSRRKLENRRREGDSQGLIGALEMLASVESSTGRYDAALPLLREAVGLIEQYAADTRLDDLMIPLLAQRTSVYYELVTALSETGRHAEAFAYAERARARSLLQLLGHSRLDSYRGAEPFLVTEAEAARARLVDSEARVRSASDAASLAALRQQADAARKELEDLTFRIKLSNPQTAAFTQVQPLESTEVQALLAPETTLISFLVTNFQTHAWVITRDRFEPVTLEVRRERLVDRILEFRKEISVRTPSPPGERDRGVRLLEPGSGSPESPESASEELTCTLLASLLPHVRTRRLVLVPHDALHDLPFAALRQPGTGRFLVEDYELSYLPSASALRFLERRTGEPEGRALVLGDPAVAAVEELPDLKGARREAQRVGRFLGVTPLLGAEATETALRDRARGVDVLHLAAHNLPSPVDPRFSYLALAPDDRHDGKLEMREIFEELDLTGVDLVTLSACETALGERTGGDEVMGLTRALLSAGAGSVLATLWSVEDEASATLMTSFYARLQVGEPAARALAAAQRELVAAQDSAAPFYWAAYTLVGEPWRGPVSTTP